jgi:signal transduction histidine kinase/ligand-binding sensor domain-containing protein
VSSAQEPEVTLDQLNHRAYGLLEGAPSSPWAFAQTTDGTLWIGSSAGLSRFDGMRFTKYPGASDEPLPTRLIEVLLASPDGGLWIGFTLGGVGFLKAGHLTVYTEKDGLPSGTVSELLRDRDGTLWIATNSGLARLRGGHCERVASDLIDRVRSLALDKTGALWVQTFDRVLVRREGQSEFHEMGRLTVTENIRGLDSELAVAPDGSVWAAFPDTLLIFSGSQAQSTALTRLKGGHSPLMFDRDGNLWAREALTLSRWENSRLISERSATLADIEKQSEPRESRSDHGFNRPTALFEDREGNVWVGTLTGVERYSLSTVRPISLPPCAGVPNTLSVDDAGAFWSECIRSTDPNSFVLMKVRGGSVVAQYETEKWFSAGYRARDGTVWIGNDVELAHLAANRLVETPIPLAARGIHLQAITEDRDGSLWVSVIRKGVFHVVASGDWVPGGGLEALTRLGPAIVEMTDRDGSIWLGYPNSLIARLQDGKVHVFDSSQGLSIGGVESISATGGQLWAGGELGLARFDGARFISILNASGNRFSGLSGIVATHDGDLWLNGAEGITRVPHAEIEHVIRDPDYHVQSKTFDVMDGVPGSASQLRTIPSALDTGNGQLWFEMAHGLVLIDSQHLIYNTLPPPVTLWSLSSNDKEYRAQGSELRLPVHTTSVDFNYSAGSLTVPEHVRFRYKLEGSDRDWQDGGNRRDAHYTNLGPGRYTFRVTASNNDGVWNTAGASVVFEILPAFYQTKWFYALCALACVAISTGLYRVRVRQLRREFNIATERKRAEQALRQLESDLAHMNRISMLGELSASLAHEVKQPIAAARNNARAALNFLHRQPPDLSEVGEAAACVVDNVDRAAEIIDRIREQAKKSSLRKQPCDVNAAINEVIGLARGSIKQNGVSAETRLADGLLPVQGDRVQLQQVVLNLILNAVEAMSSVEVGARELLISTDQDHTGVLVAVRDSGPGIDPEHVERVFQSFYTTKPGGTGMGLSICRSIIEAHGGRLWAGANEPRGAVFWFTLPGTG